MTSRSSTSHCGELGDPLDLVGDGAELLVEDDLVELLRLLGERDLEVLVPEEFGVGEARGEHLLVAGDDRGADRWSRCWRRRRSGCESLPLPSWQAKYFWLVRMVSWITSGGSARKAGSKLPLQRHRPFGEAGILGDQALVRDESGGLRCSLAAPSRMIALRSSWSTMTWQARSFST